MSDVLGGGKWLLKCPFQPQWFRGLEHAAAFSVGRNVKNPRQYFTSLFSFFKIVSFIGIVVFLEFNSIVYSRKHSPSDMPGIM